MKKSLIKEAYAIARRNIELHPENGRFIHFSFVVQHGKIIEWGVNHAGVPRKHYGYHNRLDDPTFKPKTHSEADAWKKARGLLDKQERWSMINVRLNRRGELRNSKPCLCCYGLLTALGCEYFYFSTNETFLKC